MLRCPRDLTSMRLQTELRTSNVVTRLWGNGEPIASDKDVRLKSRLMTLSSVAPCSHPVTVSAARSISSDPESSCVPDSRPSCVPNLRSHSFPEIPDRRQHGSFKSLGELVHATWCLRKHRSYPDAGERARLDICAANVTVGKRFSRKLLATCAISQSMIFHCITSSSAAQERSSSKQFQSSGIVSGRTSCLLKSIA